MTLAGPRNARIGAGKARWAPRAAAALLAVALPAAAAADEPKVHRHDDGAYTIRYDGGCKVTYDVSGRRTGSEGCRPGQVDRADDAVQEDVHARGGGGLKFHKLSTGAAKVTFDDGCVVTYNKDGRRSGSEGCHPRQVARADKSAQKNW